MDPNISVLFLNAITKEQMEFILEHASLPNLPIPTLGGHVFWNTLAEKNGWKLQKNMITQHCRILDSDDVRRAWGSTEAMHKLLSYKSE